MINNVLQLDLVKANKFLKELEPLEIIEWVMKLAKNPMLTTNFGPYSASLVHAVNRVDKGINVIWCDTGHNTSHTYKYALNLIDRFSLNMHVYKPNRDSVYQDTTNGIPFVDSPEHAQFTEEVKLEPFRRALNEHQPDIWFTNLRAEQNEHRSTLDILHIGKEGILKVSPFFHYSEFDLELYLQEYGLPNEKRYYDPTKVLAKRECGLHI